MAAMSVCRNFLVHEWEAADEDLYLQLTGGHFPQLQKDGKMPLPEGPGLGISVDFAEFKKRYPYKKRYLPAGLKL